MMHASAMNARSSSDCSSTGTMVLFILAVEDEGGLQTSRRSERDCDCRR